MISQSNSSFLVLKILRILVNREQSGCKLQIWDFGSFDTNNFHIETKHKGLKLSVSDWNIIRMNFLIEQVLACHTKKKLGTLGEIKIRSQAQVYVLKHMQQALTFRNCSIYPKKYVVCGLLGHGSHVPHRHIEL